MNLKASPDVHIDQKTHQLHIYIHGALLVAPEIKEANPEAAGGCPERFLRSTVDLRPDWRLWQVPSPFEVVAPELAYEGADPAPAASQRGCAPEQARQLRDPRFFEEDRRTFLLYSVAVETEIAAAEIRA